MTAEQHIPMAKVLRIMASGTAVIAVVAAGSAFALEKSLPYRIGPDNYARYLWAGRLFIAALIIPLLATGFGIASHQRLPTLLGACSLVASFSFMPGSVHSGPNPASWCYGNLRRIDAAKEQFVRQNNLTNGATISSEEISPYIEGAFGSLRCYEHGHYIIGPVGTEPRCSYHGSLAEIVPGPGQK
jgi:hypothetical protein